MNYNILLIDDEIFISDSIRDFLEDEEGFTVKSAYSGESGLHILDSFCPDACIVDMRLPGINGNDFIIKAHKRCPDCKFIIHSGSIDYTPSLELMEIGINKENVITKPVQDLFIFSTKIFYLLEKEQR